MYYYSATENAFYNDVLNKELPADVKEISNDEYRMLLDEMNNNRTLTSDETGAAITIRVE